MEESSSVEENDGDDAQSLEHNDDLPMMNIDDDDSDSDLLSDNDDAPPPVPMQTADPPANRPLVNDDEILPDDNVIVRPGKRTIRRRQIYDPSDACFLVELMLDNHDVPIPHLSAAIIAASHNPASFADSIEGCDPTAYLPEPQSLKGLKHLSPNVRDAWLKAYRVELMNMLGKDTFKKPTNYNGEKCLPVRILHKTKLRSDGMVDKLKVRVAMRGDMDAGAVDEDNSAPLATFRVLKCFLAGAAKARRRVYQSDYVGAYLQAYMDRIVYVMLPAALAEYFPDLAEWFGVPLLLNKSAYGINSAGRLWAEELFGWYVEYGFQQSDVEPSLFTYHKGDDWIILLNYCDDTAYYASSDSVRIQFETAMCARFECKLLGQLHWFLQARITQSENYNITLDQSRYAASICSRFLPNSEILNPSSKDCSTYAGTLPNGIIFTKKDCSANYFEVHELEEQYGFKYPVVVGCLLWILNTYPRLQFPIRKLAKYMQLPGKIHFKAMHHLLHHIRCHHLNGLTYYSDVLDAPISRLMYDQGVDPYDKPFYAFADSSWQDCPDTGRSTGGFHIYMQGGIVDSAMTFPVPVALSSAEAEYLNLSCAGAAIAGMGMLYQSMNFLPTDDPLGIPVLVDNKACISMALAVKDSKHMRHIFRRFHYNRYLVGEGYMVPLWVPANYQMADPATKALSPIAPTYVVFRAVSETPVNL